MERGRISGLPVGRFGPRVRMELTWLLAEVVVVSERSHPYLGYGDAEERLVTWGGNECTSLSSR